MAIINVLFCLERRHVAFVAYTTHHMSLPQNYGYFFKRQIKNGFNLRAIRFY